MPSTTYTYSAATGLRIVNAYCAKYEYQDTIDGLPNPETKAQFTDRMIRRQIKAVVAEREAQTAQTLAFEDAVKKAEAEIIIT